MSKQTTISTEAQLREAVRALWAENSAVNWRWKEWRPGRERGLDAVGEMKLDKRRITFGVEFQVEPGCSGRGVLGQAKTPPSIASHCPPDY